MEHKIEEHSNQVKKKQQQIKPLPIYQQNEDTATRACDVPCCSFCSLGICYSILPFYFVLQGDMSGSGGGAGMGTGTGTGSGSGTGMGSGGMGSGTGYETGDGSVGPGQNMGESGFF